MARYVVGISGASGIILAFKAIQQLIQLDYDIDLVMSSAATYTALEELGPEFAGAKKFVAQLPEWMQSKVCLHSNHDFAASIASGSYQVKGMLLIPCSMATLAAVATGLSDNLLRRAVDVNMKERRRVVIVPREAPLSDIHLENMLRLSRMGAVILPPVPAWYSLPKNLSEMEDSIVGRCLDLLGETEHQYPRWRSEVSA